MGYADLKMFGYRWWTVMAWCGMNDRGVKIGPVTIGAHLYRQRWRGAVGVLGWMLWDGTLRAIRREQLGLR